MSTPLSALASHLKAEKNSSSSLAGPIGPTWYDKPCKIALQGNFTGLMHVQFRLNLALKPEQFKNKPELMPPSVPIRCLSGTQRKISKSGTNILDKPDTRQWKMEGGRSVAGRRAKSLPDYNAKLL